MKAKKKNIVVVGATSAIARHVALAYAHAGSTFFLVARNEEKLRGTIAVLNEAGGGTDGMYIADLRARELHDDIVAKAQQHLGQIDIVLIAHGVLPDQQQLNGDIDATLDSIITNELSPISLAHRFFDVLVAQGRGSLVMLSSVAGDRGRRGNYAYGTAKAALTAYMSGLRGRGLDQGVHVLTVKPGPVRTPLTEGRELPLTVNVEPVARDIVDAIEGRRKVIYTPGFWRFLMFGFKMLPEWVAARLKI
jgi:short-subunit dehydrogenase